MIDLRFVERQFDNADGTTVTRRILQSYDGHVWVDVPCIVETEGND